MIFIFLAVSTANTSFDQEKTLEMAPVIVSLTTISPRVNFLPNVIKSLLTQTRRPDRIAVNISDSAFGLDHGVNLTDLPRAFFKQLVSSKIVDIFFVENTGSYRKLLPTLLRYRSLRPLIVTVDDDVIYPPQWLEAMVDSYSRHECVIAYRCRQVQALPSGKLQPYQAWPFLHEALEDGLPSLDLFPTGRGGILYPSNVPDIVNLCDELRRLAPFQDDVVFRFVLAAHAIPVYAVPFRKSGSEVFEFVGHHSGAALFDMNADVNSAQESANDLAIRKVLRAICSKYADLPKCRLLETF